MKPSILLPAAALLATAAAPSADAPRQPPRVVTPATTPAAMSAPAPAASADRWPAPGTPAAPAASHPPPVASLPGSPPPAPPARITACLDAVAAALPPLARAVLPRIDGTDRRLLAAATWLRVGDLVEERWSWTDAEIAAYEASPEHARALAELDKVAAAFAAANPPYTLWVNTRIRSLEQQLASWNANASVAAAAGALLAETAGRCDPARLQAFVDLLRDWRPTIRPTVAAPGLSPHGRGRAFDFQVMDGKTLVAGTSSARIQPDWIDTGWADKLAAAIRAASPAFEGPLAAPNEPWHYAYRPDRLATASGPAPVPVPAPQSLSAVE